MLRSPGIRNICIVVLVVVVGVFVGYYKFGPARDRLNIDPRDLVFSPSAPFSRTIPVRNPGKSALRVSGVATSCPCLSASMQDSVIDPGGTGLLLVSIDESKVRRTRDGSANVGLVISYAALDGSRQTDESWVVHIARTPKIVIEPRTLGMREPLLHGSPQSVEAMVRCEDQVTTLAAESSGIYGRTTVSQNGDHSFIVSFETREDLPTGWFEDEITISARDAQGVLLEEQRVPIQGWVSGTFRSIPPLISLKENGDTQVSLIVVWGSASDTYEIVDVDSTGLGGGLAEILSTSSLSSSALAAVIKLSAIEPATESRFFTLELQNGPLSTTISVPVEVVSVPSIGSSN